MNTIHRLVIVGGVAGGMSAATRARRLDENVEIVVLERGPDVSFANCGLPYYVGGVITERDELLAETADALRTRFRIDVRPLHEAIALDRSGHSVRVRVHPGGALPAGAAKANGSEYSLSYDKLILSPGAHPIIPDWPGIDHPHVKTLRNLVDADAMAAMVAEKGTETPALVIGAGYIGLEMAEALAGRGIETTLVSHGPQVLGSADPEMTAPLLDALSGLGVRLRLNTTVVMIADAGSNARVVFSNGEKGEFGLIALAVGVKPEVKLAREAGIAIGATGGIKVDALFRTSDQDILAVGDVIEVARRPTGEAAVIPLAGPANRQGRQAADNLFGIPRPYPGTLGSAVVKVGEAMLAQTGATAKTLDRIGRKHAAVHVRVPTLPGYYPGSDDFWFKILFDPETGAVLGAQAAGPATTAAEKTIDAIAMIIGENGGVSSLVEAEHAYAPPFATAKSPMNIAGFIAQDAIDDGTFPVPPYDVIAFDSEGGDDGKHRFLDVRTPEEFAEGALAGAINIEVDELRGRLAELDREKEYWVYCTSGARSHTACRILSQHGFRCRNVSGGLGIIKMARKVAKAGEK